MKLDTQTLKMLSEITNVKSLYQTKDKFGWCSYPVQHDLWKEVELGPLELWITMYGWAKIHGHDSLQIIDTGFGIFIVEPTIRIEYVK